MNGSIGKVMRIIYGDWRGLGLEGSLPLYAVTHFPEPTLNHTFIQGCDTTYISIPVINDRCEKQSGTYMHYTLEGM